jgi:AcrR family transcriptional regulator
MKQTSVVEDVMQAALELFAAQGYANTSVQQVVESAGVTKGALYHYFQSKDDLLYTIYERMLTVQTDHMNAIIARGGPVEETLRAVCVDVVETSVDFLLEGTVFFRSQHMLSAPRQQEVTRRRRAYHDTFAGLLEQGQEAGIYRTDIPRSVMVAHFFSDLHYLSYWFRPSGPEGKTGLAEQLTDLFLVSVSAQAAKPAAPPGAAVHAQG